MKLECLFGKSVFKFLKNLQEEDVERRTLQDTLATIFILFSWVLLILHLWIGIADISSIQEELIALFSVIATLFLAESEIQNRPVLNLNPFFFALLLYFPPVLGAFLSQGVMRHIKTLPLESKN